MVAPQPLGAESDARSVVLNGEMPFTENHMIQTVAPECPDQALSYGYLGDIGRSRIPSPECPPVGATQLVREGSPPPDLRLPPAKLSRANHRELSRNHLHC